MANSLKHADLRELKPRIVVMGVGGAGGNALNNMVAGGLEGVEFIAANTDAQALLTSKAETVIQIGMQLTEGLGAGSRAEIGAAAAEEAVEDIREKLTGAHMVFVTAGMGGGTGSGAAPVISRIARELGILTVGVVTKPFNFEGSTRMKTAEKAVARLRENVDTLIVIPNQNLFRVANEDTTFADAFVMADKVLHSGIACITDLMVKEGLINLDFADVKIVMSNMGKSMMGSGIASGENRGKEAALIAITNPLLDDVTLEGAKGVLISIIGGKDLTLFEVEQAAETIREVVDKEANIIVGATFDEARTDDVLVSVLATGLGGQTNAVAGIVNAPVSAPALFPAETKADDLATIPKFVPQPDMNLEYDGTNDALLGDNSGESVQLTANKADEGWRDDGGVTIKPIRPKNNAGGISDIVAEKAHKKEEVEINSNATFAAAPVKNAPKSSPKMPALEDFSPLAQQAVAAQKDETKTNEKVPASLFGRLSALGKKHPKSEEKIEAEMPSEKAETLPDMQPTDLDDIPLNTVDKTDDVAPRDLSITAEEAIEIPSFFKRKAG